MCKKVIVSITNSSWSAKKWQNFYNCFIDEVNILQWNCKDDTKKNTLLVQLKLLLLVVFLRILLKKMSPIISYFTTDIYLKLLAKHHNGVTPFSYSF